MDAPTSRKQMDKLGKRLLSDGQLSPDDRALFASILDFYQHILDDVTNRVSELGYHPTSRVKTTGTLSEKLRREQGMQLTRINDIAGLRIVLDGGRFEQDAVTAALVDEFTGGGKDPLLIDRRKDPREGYRAVHIVVFHDGFPVEIQIRTYLQDAWAQIFEKIADRWGRQIRYGGTVDSPATKVSVQGTLIRDQVARATIVELMSELSSAIDGYEASQFLDDFLEANLEGFAGNIVPSVERQVGAGRSYDDFLPDQASYRVSRDAVVTMCHSRIRDRRRRNRLIRRHFPRYRKDMSITSWARGLRTIASEMYSGLVDSRPRRAEHRQFISTVLDDLATLDEEGAA